jgi:hypothetical protein
MMLISGSAFLRQKAKNARAAGKRECFTIIPMISPESVKAATKPSNNFYPKSSEKSFKKIVSV